MFLAEPTYSMQLTGNTLFGVIISSISVEKIFTYLPYLSCKGIEPRKSCCLVAMIMLPPSDTWSKTERSAIEDGHGSVIDLVPVILVPLPLREHWQLFKQMIPWWLLTRHSGGRWISSRPSKFMLVAKSLSGSTMLQLHHQALEIFSL